MNVMFHVQKKYNIEMMKMNFELKVLKLTKDVITLKEKSSLITL